MKRIVFLCLLFFINIGIYSNEDSSSLDIALDVSYVDPLIDKILYNEITLAINIDEDLDLRIPLNLILPLSRDIDVVGFGCSVDVLYRPMFNGIFASFSLVKVEYLKGPDAPLENFQYLNKISFGYTYQLSNKWFIEPSISFFNLNGMYEDSLLELRDSFGDFPSIRPSVLIGYKLINF